MHNDNNFGKILFLKECKNHKDIKKAIIIPMAGASIIKLAICMILGEFMEANPEWAIAAPANPPIRVCEDDDGMPYHQVNKFQNIAAMSPARITVKVIYGMPASLAPSLTVLAMVLATP